MKTRSLRIPLPFTYKRVEVGLLDWGVGAGLIRFEDHYSICLHLICLSLYIPIWSNESYKDYAHWGFAVRAGSDWGWWTDWHFNWGEACKIVHMPWAWEWHRTSILTPDGSRWMHDLRLPGRLTGPLELPASERSWNFHCDAPRWQQTHPYDYVLKSGEVQNRIATVSISEMEWRWRALAWLPYPRKVRRTIDVKFSAEVGERSGSWKGGCTGCSFELRPGETPLACLRRMEQTRKF